MHLYNSIKSPWFIFLLIVLFHLCNNLIVIRLDKTPLVFDSYDYYNNAKNFFSTLNVNNSRPPLLSFLAYPVFKLFGVSQKTAILGVGALTLFFLLLSTYLLAKELYSREVGLLSIFILSSTPAIFSHSRSFMPELLLMTWVTLFVFFIVKPESLASEKSIFPLAVVFGLGMLTKIAFPLFVLGPLIYVLIKKRNFNRNVYFNLCLTLLVSFCIFVWRLPNMNQNLQLYAKIKEFSCTADTFNPLSLFEHILDYTRFILRGMGIVYLPLCLFGGVYYIALLIKNKKNPPWLPLLLIWIAANYAILIFLTRMNLRYIMPALPALVIIYSFFILNIKNNFYRKAVVILVIFLGISQTFFYSYSSLARDMFDFIRSPIESDYQWFGLLQPSQRDWKIREICDSIKGVYPDVTKRVIFIKTRAFVYDGLREMQEEGNFKVFFTNTDLCFYRRTEYSNINSLLSLLDASHIVIKSTIPEVYDCKNEDALEELFKKNIDKFSLIKTIVLPDNSTLKIYKKLKIKF